MCLTAIFMAFTGLIAACGEDHSAPFSGSKEEDSTPAPQRSNVIIRIMPLGDSITESNTGLPSYRYYLWHLAVDKGYHADFVGSRQGVGNGPPASLDFDMDHEGHARFKADDILAHIQVWATEASPHVVLLHIGHNDLCRGQSIASTVVDIGGIIDVLRTVNPHVHILLAQVIASASSCHSSIPELNASLPALVADKDLPESPLILVDQYSGFDPSAMTYDGTHPNAMGESRMADQWFEKLAPVLDSLTEATQQEARADTDIASGNSQ